MKTAFLLGSIGSGLLLLSYLYSFVHYGIIERSEYLSIAYYVQTLITIIAWIIILLGFIIAYQKQNRRSWKD